MLMESSRRPRRNSDAPRDSASIVEKPPKNVGTMPNLLQPQDEPHLPFLENHPLKPPLRKSLETLLRVWETNQRPRHPGVYLGSHGYTTHHLPCISSCASCNSHLSIRNLLFDSDPYPWHSRLYFNSNRLRCNLKLHRLIPSRNVYICTLSIGPTHHTQPLQWQACYIRVYSSICPNHCTILGRVHAGTRPPCH